MARYLSVNLCSLSQILVVLFMWNFSGLEFLLGDRLLVVIILWIFDHLSQWVVSIWVVD